MTRFSQSLSVHVQGVNTSATSRRGTGNRLSCVRSRMLPATFCACGRETWTGLTHLRMTCLGELFPMIDGFAVSLGITCVNDV